jgi:hypothetical protein
MHDFVSMHWTLARVSMHSHMVLTDTHARAHTAIRLLEIMQCPHKLHTVTDKLCKLALHGGRGGGEGGGLLKGAIDTRSALLLTKPAMPARQLASSGSSPPWYGVLRAAI